MPAKRFEEIRNLPLFADIGDDSFAALVRGAYVQNFPPHTEMIVEGDPADFLHILAAGSVELFSSWNDRDTCMTFLTPYATFILAATIKDRPYLMSGRTLTRSRIIMIPSEDIRSVFESDSEFAKAIVMELASCYRDSIRNHKNIKLRTSIERLANYLVKHHAKAGANGKFVLEIEKKKLASFLGMTPENLSRAFLALKSHGVEVSGSTIILSDSADLEAYARPYSLIDD